MPGREGWTAGSGHQATFLHRGKRKVKCSTRITSNISFSRYFMKPSIIHIENSFTPILYTSNTADFQWTDPTNNVLFGPNHRVVVSVGYLVVIFHKKFMRPPQAGIHYQKGDHFGSCSGKQ
jgi:hypothetical protein